MHKKYDIHSVRALVVVSAKEHGKIYSLKNGNLRGLSYTEEPAPTYSDNEGFFVRSKGGTQLGSGNVLETNDQHNLQQYIKAITEELSTLVDRENPEVVFVIEPEHLKGLIKENLVTAQSIPVEEIAYGNYVEKDADTVLELVRSTLSNEEDPADPSSVEGEAHAEEKRRILEIGKQVSG